MPANPAPTTSSTLRLLPAPRWDPPYDDDRPDALVRRGAGWGPTAATTNQELQGVQGTLALAFVLTDGLPATPTAPLLRLLTPLPLTAPDDETERTRTASQDLPAPGPWAGRLVQAVVEVLAGDRPSAQLVRWTVEPVYTALRASIRPTPRAARTAVGSVASVGHRAQVRSVRVSEPANGVAEVSATVQRDGRTTAVALRMEGLDGRWMCTVLELVGRRP